MGVERPILTWLTKVLKSGTTKKVAKSIGTGVRVARFCSKCNGNKNHDQWEDSEGNTHHRCATCDNPY